MNTKKLSWEKNYPAILSIVTCIIFSCIQFFDVFNLNLFLEDNRDFLSASVSLGSIWAGFSGTMMGLLLSLPKNGLVQSLINSNYIQDLHDYLQKSMVSSILFAVYSLLGILLIGKPIFVAFFVGWLTVLIYAVLCFWRSAMIMHKIMGLAHKK